MYCNVSRIGSELAIVGRSKNGKRYITKESARFHRFEPSDSGEYTDLFQNKFKRIDEPITEHHKHKESIGVFNSINQYIFETYKERVDPGLVIGYFDIEVDSTNGYPDIELAINDIQLIGLRVNGHTHLFGIKELDESNEVLKQINNWTYHYHKSQSKLLMAFMSKLIELEVDVLCGWNSEGFDIPYIVNKLRYIADKNGINPNELINPLSPLYKLYGAKRALVKSDKNQVWTIDGISSMDYLRMYKKFTFKTQESYKLDYIGEVELNKGKTDYSEYGNLTNLFNQNFELFVVYNFRDIEIIEQLEDKLGIMNLCSSMAYYAGTNLIDVFSPIKIWESIIYNNLMAQNIIIKDQKMRPNDDTYPGAFVFDPIAGLHNWIVSFDVASMYPSIIRSFNMSYETLVKKKGMIGDYIDMSRRTYSGGVCKSEHSSFKTENKGIFPLSLEKIMLERNDWKNQMFQAETELDAVKKELTKRGLDDKINIVNKEFKALA